MNCRCLCFVLISLLGSTLFAEEDRISLEEYLDHIQRNHPFFRAEALSGDIALKEQVRFTGAEDWVVRATPSYTYDDTVDPSFGAPDGVKNARAEAGVGRTFWETGGRLDLGYAHDYTDLKWTDSTIPLPSGDSIRLGGPGRFYQNAVSIGYRQPLLKNRGGALDRLAYDLQGYTIQQTELDTLENREAFLLDLGLSFLEWVQLGEEKRIAGDRLRLAEEELASTRKKLTAGVVDKVDEYRASDAVLEARRNAQVIESRWVAQRVELAVQSQDRSLLAKTPTYPLYDLRSLPEPDEAHRVLLRNARDLQQLQQRADQLEREREGLHDAEKADLGLLLAAGLKDGAENRGDAVGFDQPDVTVALAYTYPLGNRSARADLERNVLLRHQVQERISETALRLETQLRSLLVQLTEYEGVLALSRERIATAAEKTAEERRLYDQGRNELTFVIQSRDQEAVAQLLYARNAAEYHVLWLQYLAVTDALLPTPP